MKYFKMINKSRRNIQVRSGNGVAVYDFTDLQGKEALWNYTISTTNQRTREQLAELLVSLHLRLESNEESGVTMEDRKQIVVEFVQRCMEELGSENNGQDRKQGVVYLISLFLDRFEGIRELRPEDPKAAKW